MKKTEDTLMNGGNEGRKMDQLGRKTIDIKGIFKVNT